MGRFKVRTLSAALLAVALTAALVAPAAADVTTVLDGDDSPGRLDIAAAQAGHYTTAGGARWLRHRVVTYERWSNAVLDHSEENRRVSFFFKRGPGIDDFYQVWVRAGADGQLVGKMRRGQEPHITTIGWVRVWRPDRHSVTIAFPKRYLGRNLTSYRWSVGTSYEDESSSRCAGDPDEDFVVPEPAVCPDDLGRWVAHRLS